MLSVLAVVAASAPTGATALGQDRTILLGSVVRPDGTIAHDMAVVIVGGKVERVVAGDQAAPNAKDAVREFPDGAVISPGLIDLCSAAGAMGDTTERVRPIDPALSAIDAVNPTDRFLRRALESGVAAVMVTPSDANIVGGAAATFRTAATGASLDVLRADGPMTFNIGSSVLDPNRGPTSRAGALTLLRDALAQAKEGKGSERLVRVLNKQTDALVFCESAQDVDAAARTFGEYSVKPNLVLGQDALEAAADLAGSGVLVVVGPLTFNSSFKTLTGPTRLRAADLEVAFAGRSPMVEAAGLRTTAALAVRYGLDPASARRGMTQNAARVAGVADRVGTLEQGKDADVVVFSGDPLRLDAKVLEVYVKGTRAFVRPSSAPETWEQWGEWEDGTGGGRNGSGN